MSSGAPSDKENIVYDFHLLAQTQGGGGGALLPLIWLLIIPMMYFMVFRPQAQAQKKAKAFREALKAGDRVITAGGIFGTISSVEETSIVLEIAPKTRVRVLRTQIVGEQGAEAKAEAKADAKAEAKVDDGAAD